jgi:hypothetical protein
LRLGDDVLVVPVGSLGTVNAYYRQVLEKAISNLLPQARIRQEIAPAVIGATFLALKQVGVTLSEATLAQLDRMV